MRIRSAHNEPISISSLRLSSSSFASQYARMYKPEYNDQHRLNNLPGDPLQNEINVDGVLLPFNDAGEIFDHRGRITGTLVCYLSNECDGVGYEVLIRENLSPDQRNLAKSAARIGSRRCREPASSSHRSGSGECRDASPAPAPSLPRAIRTPSVETEQDASHLNVRSYFRGPLQ
jgi:hypothetical protein